MSEYQFGANPTNAGISRPSMEEMMQSKTKEFRGWIQGMDDYEAVLRAYLSIHNKPEQTANDFPTTTDQQTQLIGVLFDACHNCDNILEKPQGQSAMRVKGNSYSDLEWEIVLWPLLMSIIDAQRGICRIPNYLNCRGPVSNSYNSFMDRFNAVVDSLKASKDLTVSLFRDSMFIHRLAWRPEAEKQTKVNNRGLNERRDVANKLGIRVALDNGIHVTENRDIVDANGQVYGKAPERSAALQESLSKIKKNSRNKDREQFARQMKMNNIQGPAKAGEPKTRRQRATKAALGVAVAPQGTQIAAAGSEYPHPVPPTASTQLGQADMQDMQSGFFNPHPGNSGLGPFPAQDPGSFAVQNPGYLDPRENINPRMMDEFNMAFGPAEAHPPQGLQEQLDSGMSRGPIFGNQHHEPAGWVGDENIPQDTFNEHFEDAMASMGYSDFDAFLPGNSGVMDSVSQYDDSSMPDHESMYNAGQH
ncbi:hypothetical protein AAE478_003247 [Parahypoxylon ruwenzoriense]